jgi:hypothetical protein
VGQLTVARPEAVAAPRPAARLHDQPGWGASVVGAGEGGRVDQPVGPLLGVVVAGRVVGVGGRLKGEAGHQRAAAGGQGEQAGDDRGRERRAAVEGHAGQVVAGAAAVLGEPGDLGHGHAVAGGDHVDLAVGGEAGDLAAVVGRPDRDDPREGGRVLGDAVAGVAGRGDHGLAGGQDGLDPLLLGLGPLGAAEAEVDHVDAVVGGDVEQRLAQVGDGDAAAGVGAGVEVVDPVGDHGGVGSDPGGAGGVVEGGDHAGDLGAVGAARGGHGGHAAGVGAAQAPADPPGQVGDPGHDPGVDHGHRLAGAGGPGVVGRDHVGPVRGTLVGLEVPADVGGAVVDPADPVGLGRGHPGPAGQPPGGGADVGAPLQPDHPGPAAPAHDRAVDRGRGRPPALLPRSGREPDQHPPGHERVPPGVPGRGPAGGGGRGQLGRGRLGGGRGQGQGRQHQGEEQAAGEQGPTGQTHGVASLCMSGSDPVTGSAGTRRSLPRGSRSSGEAQAAGRLSRPGRSGPRSWPTP